MRDLADRLDIALSDVLKAAMSLGIVKTASQRLTLEEVGLVEKLVSLDRNDPPVG